MNPTEIIRAKRDGKILSHDEIAFFVTESVKKSIPEYQISAFLMAVYFQGLNPKETSDLTKNMMVSGTIVKFNDGKPKIDKHSTGGVGDKVSIILAPLVASCGVDVPMVSGRGLGHTGGTVDKMESIPGFVSGISIEDFKKMVEKIGVSMMSQTSEFVPADKLFYSLRDVTGTVESIPLITASILSKKVAEGIDGLVMDIKVGTGAFMETDKKALMLAKSIVSTGKELGIKVRALITDMNQPLGFKIGHTLEILECIEVMKGYGPEDLINLTVELAAHMLILGKKVKKVEEGRKLAHENLKNGKALSKFQELIRAHHSSFNVNSDLSELKISSHSFEVLASKSGYIKSIDTRALGVSLIDLGGGRKTTSDIIDFTVGYHCPRKIGDKIKKGDSLIKTYFNPETLKQNQITKEDISKSLSKAFLISQNKCPRVKLVKKILLS